jgi:hypothetical protein
MSKHTRIPRLHPYTTLEFNSLPGWARDTILALEAQAAAAPELLAAAKDYLGARLNQRAAAKAALEAAISKAEGK